jgi:Beta-lactamase enzyme family
MPTGGETRRPAHAGRLPPWERLAIALVLLAMAGIITVIVISAGPPHPPAVGGGAARGEPSASAQATGIVPVPAAAENQQLAAALAPVLRGRGGSLAVGVVDGQAGAVYDAERPFHSAGIVRADILAALLLQHQRPGMTVNEQQRELAAEMIENGDEAAADTLWDEIGQAAGLAAANRRLQLDHTTAGKTWQLTSTTVGDQLGLLADLTSSRSPLSAASRSYELGLMRQVTAGRRWGISAAAPAGSSPALADGSLPGRSGTWLIDSIGVIFGSGHPVLLAILSDGQPTQSAGIGEAEAAARAAVSAITGGAHPARGSGGI